MNPVFETFAALVIWAEPGLLTPHNSPSEVLNDSSNRIRDALKAYLPTGASRLTSGLLSLMRFDATTWQQATDRLMQLPLSAWREAILPASTQPARILQALSSPERGGSLLSEIGLTPEDGMEAFYRTLLSHPKNLRQEIMPLLLGAWNLGLGAWYENHPAVSGREITPVEAQSGNTVIISPLMLMAGELRIMSKAGSLVLLPYYGRPQAAVRVAPMAQSAPGATLHGQLVTSTAGTVREPAREWPDRQVNRPAALYKALSDATRLQVLEVLAEAPSYPGVVAERLSVSPPTMSHHLASLRAAGLINYRREGGYMQISLDRGGISSARDYLETLLGPAPKRD